MTIDEARREVDVAERAYATAYAALRSWQTRMVSLEAYGDRLARDREAPQKARIDQEVVRATEELRGAREALARAMMQRGPKTWE